MASHDHSNRSALDALTKNAQDCAQSETMQNPSKVEPTIKSSVRPRIEPELLSIFSDEVRQHLGTLDRLLNESGIENRNLPVSPELNLALHTLTGCARTADVPEIAELCEPLEHYVRVRKNLEKAIPVDVLQLFTKASSTIAQVLEILQDNKQSIPDNSPLRTELAQLLKHEPGDGNNEVPTSGITTSIDDLRAMHAGNGLMLCNEPREVAEPQGDSVERTADTLDQQERELIEIFLEEATDLLDDVDNTLQAWNSDPQDKIAIEQLQRQLHTLKGAARMASYSNIGDLSHALESVIIAVVDAHVVPSSDLFDVVYEVADRLHGMLEDARNSRLSDAAPQLIDALEKLKTNSSVELDVDRQDQIECIEPSNSSGITEMLTADMPNEQDRELIDIFVAEASELLDDMDNSLQAWSNDPQGLEMVQGLQRHLHTLKGGARMAGYTSIGDLSHSLESLILAVLEAGLEPNTDLFELVQQSLDRLHSMHHNVAKAEPVYPASDLLKALNEFIVDKPVALSQSELKSSRPLTDIEAHSAVPSDSNNSTQLLPDGIDTIQNIPESLQSGNQALNPSERKSGINIKPLESASTQELIRVRSELIDVLVNNAGEVNIYHARFGQQISAFSYNLGELEQTVARLRNQLRDLEMETEAQILFRYEQEKKDLEEEFDPLELDRYSTIQQLSRALSESVSDLVSIQEILVNLVRDSEMLLMQQSRVSTNLQEGLMRSRMVKFGSLAPRLSRIARQTARELGKKVKLHLIGETNELDRSVLDRMVAPLEHMLRNSISHGIDLPENRIKYNKPEVGTVRVSVARDGSEVVIQVEDDGMGVDLKAVRETAHRQGLLGPEDELSDHQIIQFILEPGFSTAREITQISGRGVGMDVVNNEIRQLGGVLSIDSEQGKGTVFTIRLPFTLAISQALLVQSGEDQYAVPLTSIEGIVRLSAAELKEIYAMQNPIYEYVDNVYKLKHLGALLGMSRPVLNDQNTMMPVLLVKSGEHRVALQTEGLAGSREIVVKPVGPQISKVRGVSGATILGDGRVVLILDVAGLIRLAATVQSMASTEELEPPVVEEQMTTVMVVDDSITIRKVTSRMLERNNYAVITAKDGVDALSQLQELKPDLFLLDIEMPRMDGYELATHIRNNDRLKEIPIIMITSRTGEKHRQRALGIGVNKYLGKPYQETDLLENIIEVLGH